MLGKSRCPAFGPVVAPLPPRKSNPRMRKAFASSARPGPAISFHQPCSEGDEPNTICPAEIPPSTATIGALAAPAIRHATLTSLRVSPKCRGNSPDNFATPESTLHEGNADWRTEDIDTGSEYLHYLRRNYH